MNAWEQRWIKLQDVESKNMDRLPDENKQNVPNCDQIRRACNMRCSGIGLHEFVSAFEKELDNEGMYLAWCAGRAFMAIEDKLPDILAEGRRNAESKAESAYQRMMARAENNMQRERDKGRW